MAKRCFEDVQHTKKYAIFRPSPPNSLIEDILSKMKNRDLAVDIGCGSGQNTKLLGIVEGVLLTDRPRTIEATQEMAILS